MKRVGILLLILYNTVLGLNFSVAPTSFQLDLEKNQTNEVYLINNTSEPLRIEVFTETPESYENNNFNDRITIFPKVFSIKPGAKQTVRFKIKIDKDMEIGEYKSLLVFREKKNKIKSENNNDTSFSTNLSFITELVIGLTGNIGEKIVDIKVIERDINYKKGVVTINTDVISCGNSSEKLIYSIQNEKGEEILSSRYGNSLKNGKKNIVLSTKLENKDYKKLRLFIKSKEGENIYLEKSLDI
ncbi:molecular chaperone [Fusobacterium sp.]|uniref:molecular chaperone n=1 Tax=Fusobacterium sp. TaxID=68766 RepID=UPI002611085E|nr:molecular chaperone [Fusobacterium sp.]